MFADIPTGADYFSDDNVIDWQVYVAIAVCWLMLRVYGNFSRRQKAKSLPPSVRQPDREPRSDKP